MAVDPAVHVAGVKEAEQAVGRLAGDGAEHFRAVRDELVAGVAELLDVVDAVLALGAGGFLREEVGGAAAEDDLGLDVVEHPDDVGLVGAAAGVGDDGGGRGVLDLGVAHDADGLVGLAAQKLGDRLLLRIVLAGLGAVGVDAEGVDARLVARHVGGGGVGAVGGDRVDGARAEKSHVRHVVHGERSVVHAVRHALGEDAGGGAVTDGEAVGKKNDDVLGNRLFWRRVDVPVGAHFAFGALDDDFVAAGLLDLDVADDEGGTVDVVLLLHPDFLAGERLGVVGTVDLNGDVLAGDALVKLDLEVEAGVRHEAGLIDGIDLGGAGLAGGNEGEKRCGDGSGRGLDFHNEFLQQTMVRRRRAFGWSKV